MWGSDDKHSSEFGVWGSEKMSRELEAGRKLDYGYDFSDGIKIPIFAREQVNQ